MTTVTPQSLIQKINDISDSYYAACQELAEISERSGSAWLELRKECGTDSECNRRWAATADGRRENYLKWLVKGMEKRRGAWILEHKMNHPSL